MQAIDLMKEIGTHRNILSMVGYGMKTDPIMLIMEYVPKYGICTKVSAFEAIQLIISLI